MESQKVGAGPWLLAASLGLGLFPAACNGGGEAGSNPLNPGGGDSAAVMEGRLIGKWILRQYHSEGYLKVGAATYPLDADTAFTDDNCYFDLKAGRTFVSDLPDSESGTRVEVGTWSYAGGTLTLIGSEDGVGEADTVAWKVSITGTDGEFSSHTEEKDDFTELKETVLINAVKQ